MDSPALRKNTIETLALLVERYPNLPIGRIVAEASQNFDPYISTDEEMARGLNQLFVAGAAPPTAVALAAPLLP